MNSDFGFRTPLNGKKLTLSELLNRIQKIASGDFSPVGSPITEAVTLNADEHEIFLYTVNHNGIYRSRITPIIANYQRKMGAGKFDRSLGIKGFMYAVEDGIKEYSKEYGTVKLSPASRMKVAEKMLEYYAEEIGMRESTTPSDSPTLDEVSPPSGPARRFTKKPEVKKSFKKQYGDRWKEVMYGTAWKMYNRKK